MSRRPDNMDTTRLTIELLKRTPLKTKVTAAQLHEQLKDEDFGRDLPTIQRHLETLCKHFDFERDDRSKPYGYQ